jgi:hypothetical protein
MDDEMVAGELSPEDAVRLVAQDFARGRFDVSIDDAVVTLATMALERGMGLVDMAREIVDDTPDRSDLRCPRQDSNLRPWH